MWSKWRDSRNWWIITLHKSAKNNGHARSNDERATKIKSVGSEKISIIENFLNKYGEEEWFRFDQKRIIYQKFPHLQHQETTWYRGDIIPSGWHFVTESRL